MLCPVLEIGNLVGMLRAECKARLGSAQPRLLNSAAKMLS